MQMQDNQTIVAPPTNTDPRSKTAKTFAFDKSYWSFNRNDAHFAGQDDLFADLGRPLLDNAFKGYNNCIFAYGQTGSGKSYSMMGYGAESGVIPRICKEMFDRIEAVQEDRNLNCTVEVSYLEIYNERVRDLLNPTTKGNLRVREHPSTGPYVEDLAKLVVRSFQEIESLMDEGNKARTVAATNMNETSSRSHAVFTLTLTQKRHDVETNMDTEKVAKISLVDLAGSERATSTGATGARLKEGAEINRSLSTLGRVIAALADLSSGRKKNASLVPYRDSVLTWLLKDSLGGNSLTAMIAAISPADINFEETLSTLRYADSAKRIKNHAVVNEDPNARMIRELKEELSQLRAKLSGGSSQGVFSDEQYSSDTPLDQQMVSLIQADGSVKRVSKAEIAEQLSQSENLYRDLNQTWEQKLQRTEEIHKERETALEELGISIEKGFVGMSTPKKMPHLVNLSDDPLLAECLLYNLKPGTTTVGNAETAMTAEIRLNGSKILHEHCTFENIDGIVTVVPKDNAGVMVNGLRIERPKRLRSGYRIILGDFHIFRFNHPQEARAERAEQGSLLRHTMNASDFGSPSLRPAYERARSSTSRRASDPESDEARATSPAPFRGTGRDSDWAFARREAVTAVLGADQKIASLTDDELDMLFDDLQRVRAGRKARPESRLFDAEDDSDSVASYLIREKYASNGTIDNFSLDTALTIPSTPQLDEEDERSRFVREDMQSQLDKQRDEYQEKLKVVEESSVEIEEIRAEKHRMEDDLRKTREEMQLQLQQQKEEFERQLLQLTQPTIPTDEGSSFTELQLNRARRVLEQWKQRRYVSMAGTLLQNAAILKEAQVMSQQMNKNVLFQFCIVDVGHTFGSSYDLVLNGISGDDDEDLDVAVKPCIGVRVIDCKNRVIHLWSVQKLRKRVRLMRQMHQYLNRPEYLQHFRLENPFSEACMPAYSRIGDVDVPLSAVFEARVQDFALDVISPYTLSLVGIVRLSVEPSSAEAPSSTLKFNVVIHDLVGFPEREGYDVHAQLFVLGLSEEGGATTTQMINNFDEGPIRFESVHSMSLPLTSPRNSLLRVSIFARVTLMYFDKLLSWDDMRDSAPRPKQKRQNSRLAESEYYTEEKHDVFTKIQIQEIDEEGDYKPVEVVQNSALDVGAYQLHQGLQRRVVINATHSSTLALQWQEVSSLRIGNVCLLDSTGSAPDLDSPQAEVPLNLVAPPVVRNNADGTCNVKLVGQWDSSTHHSLILDRTTAEKYRVRITLSWDVTCTKLITPMLFSLDLAVQIRSRAYIRPTSLLTQLWNAVRIVHSTTGIFSVSIKPTAAKRAADLWRMDSHHAYVKGEELLTGWTPRGVSLVNDFVEARQRRRRTADIEAARGLLGARALSLAGSRTPPRPDDAPTPAQAQLLRKVLTLWRTRSVSPAALLAPTNTRPPRSGAAFAPPSPTPPSLHSTVTLTPKNPTLLKSGFLHTPSADQARWLRRHVELRPPYLHVHSVPEGDEVDVVNLSNARIDCEPQVARLLARRAEGRVWAVYAVERAWLFGCRGEREVAEWVWAIEKSWTGGDGSGGSSEGEGV